MSQLLSSLYSYAVAHSLEAPSEERDFPLKLVLNESGFVGLEILNQALCVPPQVMMRGNKTKPNLGYDNISYVLGIGLVERAERFPAFWKHTIEQLTRAGAPEGVLTAVKAFQDTRESWREAALACTRAFTEADPKLVFEGGEWVVIEVQGHGYLHNTPGLRQDIENIDVFETTGICAVSGVACNPTRLHPAIKGVLKDAVPLVSYNGTAYEFEGLEQGANFPTSATVAQGYTNALNDLLFYVPDRPGRRKNGINLPSGAVLVLWSNDPEVDVQPLIDVLYASNNKEDREVVSRTWAAFEALKESEAEVHVLLLVGYRGRISINRWTTVSLTELLVNLRSYRQAFAKFSEFPSMYELLENLSSEKPQMENPKKYLPKQILSETLKSSLYEAVLFGEPIPKSVYQYAVNRMVRSNPNSYPSEHGWFRQMAILNAWISLNQQQKDTMTEPTNSDGPQGPQRCNYIPKDASPAFHEGRFLACAEEYQYIYAGQKPGTTAKVGTPFGSKLSEFSTNTTRSKVAIQSVLVIFQRGCSGPSANVVREELDDVTFHLALHQTPGRATPKQRQDICQGYFSEKLYLKDRKGYRAPLPPTTDGDENTSSSV